MEILRVPPYPLSVSYDVPDSSTSYLITVEDMVDHSVTTGVATSNANGKLSISLPSGYDGEYKVVAGEYEDVFTVVRPYVDPTTKGTTASEIAAYAKQEEIARAIIDSVIPQGFYYEKYALQTTGLGSDYIPLWVDAKDILSVQENNVLVYSKGAISNVNYEITTDTTAITRSYTGELNRLESAPNVLPSASSDIIGSGFMSGVFPKTFDYTFILAVGYKNIPSDIVRATEMIIDDIACGKLDYYSRYVAAYDTDQFKLKFDKQVFEGTGNIIVDKILSKYAKSITTVGVL